MSESVRLDDVKAYLHSLQQSICGAIEQFEPTARFKIDAWDRPQGGTGRTTVIENGEVFERGGVSFSHVYGDQLPASASARRPQLAGRAFEVMGVSLVLHPRNPYVPTTHMNVRLLWR